MPTIDLSSMIKPKPVNYGGLFNNKPMNIPAPAPMNINLQKPPISQTDPAKVAAATSVKKTGAPVVPPVVPPTTPNAGQAGAIASGAKAQDLVTQLLSTQDKLSQAKGAGYGNNETIQHDDKGNVIPKNNENPTPAPTPTDPSLYESLITGGKSALEKSAGLKEQESALRKSITEQELGVMGDPTKAGSVRTGLASMIEANRGAELSGLGSLESAANTRGQAFFDAAGKAAPVQVPYNNQFINPLTGEPIGGTGVASGNLNDSVTSIAQKIQNGTMGYDDGLKALSAYGQGGVNALQKILGPNFDVVGSNAKAAARATSIGQTGSTGGQLTKASDSANAALDKLSSDFSELSKLQTDGIPATNSIANWIASKFGQDKLSTYSTTLEDARAQLAGVLTATGATTPTGADSMARTYLPDDMTPAQFSAKIAAAKALIQQKVSAFTSENGGGTNGGGNGAGTGGQYDW